MTQPHPDQIYIKALIDNDQPMLNELYARCSEKIKWMVLQNNGNEDDAADVFQEALLDIYQKAKEGFVLTCPMDAFLYLVCRNRWINHLTRRKSRIETFKDAEGYKNMNEDVFMNAEQLLIDQQRRALLAEKIGELGESCRKLLQLSWSGVGLEEVARLMNTTYAYIRKKKSECIGKLIDLVKNSPDYKLLLY